MATCDLSVIPMLTMDAASSAATLCRCLCLHLCKSCTAQLWTRLLTSGQEPGMHSSMFPPSGAEWCSHPSAAQVTDTQHAPDLH